MDIRQIRYFLKVVELGSFSKAAAHLGLAQPGLGAQIRKLEQEFQVQLLIRTARGIELTAAGTLLRDSGARITADLDRLAQHLRDLAGPPSGQITLGITPSLGELVLPLIRACDTTLPGVKLGIVEELSVVLSEWVEAGRVDFALAFDVRPTRGLVIRPLLTQNMCLIEKRRSGQATGPVRFADLAGCKLILPPRPHRVRQLVEDAAERSRTTLTIAYEMQSVPTILRLVEGGLGVTLLAEAAGRQAGDGDLISRNLIEPSVQSRLALIFSDSRPLGRIEPILTRTVKSILG